MKPKPRWYQGHTKAIASLVLGFVIGVLFAIRTDPPRPRAMVYEFEMTHFHCVEHLDPYVLICTPKRTVI